MEFPPVNPDGGGSPFRDESRTIFKVELISFFLLQSPYSLFSLYCSPFISLSISLVIQRGWGTRVPPAPTLDPPLLPLYHCMNKNSYKYTNRIDRFHHGKLNLAIRSLHNCRQNLWHVHEESLCSTRGPACACMHGDRWYVPTMRVQPHTLEGISSYVPNLIRARAN